MSIEKALERLRAADPAAVAEPVWEGPPAVLDDVPRRRPVAVMLAAAAAVVLVAGIAVALAVGRGSGSTDAQKAPTQGAGPPSQPVPARTLITPGAADPSSALTRALLTRLLASTRLPAHSVRVSSAPVSVLRNPSTDSGYSTHEIRLTRWFTAPGSVSAASAYFSAHPPRGTTLGSQGTDDDVVNVEFDGGSRSEVASSSVTVVVDIAPYRGGVAVRIDAYAFWLPSRTTDSIIGVPTSAVATVTVAGQAYRKPRTVTRHLTGSTAARLAHEIDDLPGGVEMVHSCPALFVTVTETLSFSTPRGTYVVRPTNSQCGQTTELRTPGGRTYPLGLGTLFTDVLSALGLPENYGQR